MVYGSTDGCEYVELPLGSSHLLYYCSPTNWPDSPRKKTVYFATVSKCTDNGIRYTRWMGIETKTEGREKV